MKTFEVTIFDAGVKVQRTIEAIDIEAACDVMEHEMREAEEVTAGNPDCEPRTDWSCIVTANSADCSLKTPGERDSQGWLKVEIKEQNKASGCCPSLEKENN